MNRSQFRKQYIYSLLLTVVGTLIIIGAIMFFIWSSLIDRNGFMAIPIDDKDALKNVTDFMASFLVHSFYAITGVVLYFVGMIWNIVISFMRSNRQQSAALGLIVASGWLLAFIFPVMGWLISIGTQIWGWFEGSKLAPNESVVNVIENNGNVSVK